MYQSTFILMFFFSFPNQIIGTINLYIHVLCIIESQVELIACEMYQEQYL